VKSASMDFFPEVVSIVLLRDDDLVTRESLSCKSDTFFRPVFLGGISTFVIQMDNSQHSAMSIGDDCHMEHARYLHSFGNLSKNWDEHEQKVQRVK